MKIGKRILYGSLIVGAFTALLSAGGKGIVADAAATNTYYDTVDLNLKGDAFLNQLTTLVNTGSKVGTYDDVWTGLCYTDEDPNNKNNIICFYTGVSIPKSDQDGKSSSSIVWNREHIWAQSHGIKNNGADPHNDLHHLRACEKEINRERGNLDFDEVNNHGGATKSDGYGNYWNGSCFEPRDVVKGDVARQMLYMQAKYNGTNGFNLDLVDKIPTTTSSVGAGKFGKLSTLLKWHQEDPVDSVELLRNERIYELQKNRNPFIDHPEYVNNIYGTNIEFPDNPDIGGGGSKPQPDINQYNVDTVISMIDALPANVTLGDKTDVENAKAVYDTLNQAEKNLVTNYSKLANALKKINELENPGGGTTPEPKPDTPVVGGDTVTIDFTKSGGKTTSYESNKTITVSNHSFFLNKVYISGSDFRVGGKNLGALTDLGISSNGAYIKSNFTLKNLKSFDLKVKTSLDKCGYKLFFTEEGATTFTEVASGNINKNFNGNITYSLPEAKNGYFTFAVLGNTARVDLESLTLKCEAELPADITSFINEETRGGLSLAYDSSTKEILDLDLRLGGRIKATSYNPSLKYGVYVTDDLSLSLNKGLNDKALLASKGHFIEITPVRVDENGNEDSNGEYYQFSVVLTNMEGHYTDTLKGAIYVELDNKLYLANYKEASCRSISQEYMNKGLIDNPVINEILGKI